MICVNTAVKLLSRLLVNCDSRASRTKVSASNVKLMLWLTSCAVIDGDIAYWKAGA